MKKSSTLPVALVQERNHGDAEANLAVVEQRVAEAAAQGAKLVLLQELHNGAYFCQHESVHEFDRAEPIPGPSTERLGRLAQRHGVVLVSSLFERRAAGLYHNTAVVFDADGANLGLYRKMHIPDDPLFYEKFYFTPGDLGFQAFDTRAGRIGALICWDQWYPEGARLTALRGASVLFYPTAIGWHPHEKDQYGADQRSAWQTIQRAHAIANGVFVAVVNRVGHEKPLPEGAGLQFWGSSFLADPFGVVVAEASTDREEILVGEVDLARMEEVRRNWPFLRDRRIDAYVGLDRRFLD
jgi:N-carbamoylputrescine amidase